MVGSEASQSDTDDRTAGAPRKIKIHVCKADLPLHYPQVNPRLPTARFLVKCTKMFTACHEEFGNNP